MHGNNIISIPMLKICGDSINKFLELIFKQTLVKSTYPSDWKKGNIVPVHKKSDKQNIKNYDPVPLPPICGKVFEINLFNNMFTFSPENTLLLKTNLDLNLITLV